MYAGEGMIEKIDDQLLKILSQEESYVSAKRLSIQIGKSVKTVQTRLNEMNSYLEKSGASIEVKRGYGYKLTINDERAFQSFYSANQFNELVVTQDILTYLITADEYVKADDMADHLYLSKSTLTKGLNQIRQILGAYSLKLVVRPHYGFKIVGQEFDIRRFLTSNYVRKTTIFQKDESVMKDIRVILDEVIENLHYHMPDYLREALVYHIHISLVRITKGKLIDNPDMIFDSVENEEVAFLDKLLVNLEKYFDIVYPQEEKDYLLIQIISKKELESNSSSKIPEEINELVEKVFNDILRTTGIDLHNDFDLRVMLGLHLVPLKFRLEHNVILKNPLYEQIRTECVGGYELSLVAASTISNVWGYEISEEELSYFALHFNVALKKEHEKVVRRNILIVCGSGRASAQMILYSFKQHFGQYIENAYVCDRNQVESYLDQHDIDYIFTTISLEISTSIPILEFSFFLNERQVKKIKSLLSEKVKRADVIRYFRPSMFFIDLESTNKEDVLREMVGKIRKKNNLPNNFLSLVLERETLFSTDLLQNVAIPHPVELCTDTTFVSVALLKQPIFWGKQKVKIVLLASLERNSSERLFFLYEWLIQLFSDQENVHALLESPSYETFMNQIVNLL